MTSNPNLLGERSQTPSLLMLWSRQDDGSSMAYVCLLCSEIRCIMRCAQACVDQSQGSETHTGQGSLNWGPDIRQVYIIHHQPGMCE